MTDTDRVYTIHVNRLLPFSIQTIGRGGHKTAEKMFFVGLQGNRNFDYYYRS